MIARYGIMTSMLFAAVHFVSHGYVAGERYLTQRYHAAQTAVVGKLAHNFGYELRRENPDVNATLEHEATKRGLSPALLRAMMHVESRGKQFAFSPKGAIGLMQVMPFNAKFCNLEIAELLDPHKNVMCGAKIMAAAMSAQRDDVRRALQEYNGGAKCIDRCQESIKYAVSVINKMGKV